MAPKKVVKSKKEDVVEIPKSETIPDGIVTHFIGGWSARQSLAALSDITKSKNGDRVVILPGYPKDGDVTVEVRSLTIDGARAVAAPAPSGEGANEDGGDGEGGADTQVVAPKEPQVDTSVTVAVNLTLAAWVPPVEIKAPTPAPIEDPKKGDPKAATAAAGKAKEKKKVTVVEEEAPPPPAPAELPPATGANPGAWPTVSFAHICFRGTIVAKGVHVSFEDCHFIGGATHQVQAHQYCKVKFTRCTFSAPSKSCVYAFPRSNVNVADCVFTGVDLSAEQTGDGKVLSASEEAAARTPSVGVHADDADVVVSGSSFRKLSIGVLLHDKCKAAAVTKNSFDAIYNTGCHMEGCAALFQGNKVRSCAYYALNITGKATPKLLQNEILSKVRIAKGAAPLLHSNTCALPVEDRNDDGNVYMQPTY
jgi:hypothetical protein